MSTLADERCAPCHGGTPPLARGEAEALAADLPGRWSLSEDGRGLRREIVFKDFGRAMGFLNRLAEVAEAEDHHPDFCLHGWNKVTLMLITHAIGGLSRNDFILAAKLGAAVRPPMGNTA